MRGGDQLTRVEKPNFRSPLIESDPKRILDPYWQRILLRQADAINLLMDAVEAQRVEIDALKQYNITNP